MRSSAVGDLLALAATVFWAGGFVLARGLAGEVPPLALNFWRWVIAAAVVVPFTVPAVRRDWAAVQQHRRYLLVTAVLGVSVYNTLVYAAGRTTDAVNLSLIGVCSPIVILLLARVFGGEPITVRRLAGIGIAVAGVVVLVTEGSVGRLTSLTLRSGDVWMLAATVVFGVYSILVRRRPKSVSMSSFVGATFVAGTVILLPGYLVEQAVVGGFPATAPVAGGLIYLGVGASVLAFAAWTAAIDRNGAARPAIIYYLIPALTAAGAYTFLNEDLGIVQVVSMALIVGGTALGTSEPSNRQQA